MSDAPAEGAPQGGLSAGPRADSRGRPGSPRPGSPRRGSVPSAPPLFERLGFRLSSLLAVALLPLGIMGLLQADAWRAAAREQAGAALMGDTLRAAAPAVGLIREAQGSAIALAQVAGRLAADSAACVAAMTDFNAAQPQYSIAAFVPASGVMTCGSGGRAFDYRGTPLFESMVADGFAPKVYVQARGPVSGVSIVLVVEPVDVDGDGAADGYVGLALPHAALKEAEAGADVADDPSPDFVTFNGDGVVLTTSLGFGREAEILPAGADLASYVGEAGRGFVGDTAAGEERDYAVVPVVEGAIYALGSLPVRRDFALGPVAAATPFLFVTLMWLGSLLVAWIAAERLVTRHIRRLGRAIRSFAGGSRVVGELDMGGAPAEIRDVGGAFLRMTDTILHDEAELEDTVHQREVLLREVHHRVKNNLQLIASIMNMQMRRAKSPETRALMRGLQERVMSLATVHKELYQTTGMADVRADELLGDITRQIMAMASGPGRSFRVDMDFAPLHLAPDQAVPLALLLTEGITNALKYAAPGPGEAAPDLRLRFAPTGPGRAELSILNTAPLDGEEPSPGAPGPEGTGLGRQLILAFASQLGGEPRVELTPGRHALRVEFSLSSLAAAEERRAAAEGAPDPAPEGAADGAPGGAAPSAA